ncbi:hypothetical protein [Shewanella mangrovisoli]|uniref:hypothetical protein n=1 Tax=Shewanella mangrovisoli TaxID=2864211 RepID=UPI003709D45C
MAELKARTMLVDPTSGKHIKRIDERTITDFFQLLHGKSSEDIIYIPDFSELISNFNQSLTKLLAHHSDKELRVMHSTVYNMWNKAKVASNTSVKEKLNIEVLAKSEEILNTLHGRLPSYERAYTNPQPSFSGYSVSDNDIDQALDNLLAEVRVFTEVVLCHIHSSVLLDPALIREPSIYQHCAFMKTKLREWLLRESGINLRYGEEDKYWMDEDSLVYQLCIEDNLNFSAELMLPYLELSDIKDKFVIKNAVFNNIISRRGDRCDWNCIEWPKANESKISRASKILQSLTHIDSLLKLIYAAETKDVKYDIQEDAFFEIKQLTR